MAKKIVIYLKFPNGKTPFRSISKLCLYSNIISEEEEKIKHLQCSAKIRSYHCIKDFALWQVKYDIHLQNLNCLWTTESVKIIVAQTVTNLEIHIFTVPDTMSCTDQFVPDIKENCYKFVPDNDCDQLFISRLVVIVLCMMCSACILSSQVLGDIVKTKCYRQVRMQFALY